MRCIGNDQILISQMYDLLRFRACGFEYSQVHLITHLNEFNFIDIEEVVGLIPSKSPHKREDVSIILLLSMQ